MQRYLWKRQNIQFIWMADYLAGLFIVTLFLSMNRMIQFLYINTWAVLNEVTLNCNFDVIYHGNSYKIKLPLSKGSRQKKKHDILWHRVKFIWYLPTLPNYDKIYYDI